MKQKRRERVKRGEVKKGSGLKRGDVEREEEVTKGRGTKREEERRLQKGRG